MKPLTFKYEDPANQRSFFRGYIKSYHGSQQIITTCTEVRTTQAEAERDAKKLIKQLSTATTRQLTPARV